MDDRLLQFDFWNDSKLFLVLCPEEKAESLHWQRFPGNTESRKPKTSLMNTKKAPTASCIYIYIYMNPFGNPFFSPAFSLVDHCWASNVDISFLLVRFSLALEKSKWKVWMFDYRPGFIFRKLLFEKRCLLPHLTSILQDTRTILTSIVIHNTAIKGGLTSCQPYNCFKSSSQLHSSVLELKGPISFNFCPKTSNQSHIQKKSVVWQDSVFLGNVFGRNDHQRGQLGGTPDSPVWFLCWRSCFHFHIFSFTFPGILNCIPALFCDCFLFMFTVCEYCSFMFISYKSIVSRV